MANQFNRALTFVLLAAIAGGCSADRDAGRVVLDSPEDSTEEADLDLLQKLQQVRVLEPDTNGSPTILREIESSTLVEDLSVLCEPETYPNGFPELYQGKRELCVSQLLLELSVVRSEAFHVEHEGATLDYFFVVDDDGVIGDPQMKQVTVAAGDYYVPVQSAATRAALTREAYRRALLCRSILEGWLLRPVFDNAPRLWEADTASRLLVELVQLGDEIAERHVEASIAAGDSLASTTSPISNDQQSYWGPELSRFAAAQFLGGESLEQSPSACATRLSAKGKEALRILRRAAPRPSDVEDTTVDLETFLNGSPPSGEGSILDRLRDVLGIESASVQSYSGLSDDDFRAARIYMRDEIGALARTRSAYSDFQSGSGIYKRYLATGEETSSRSGVYYDARFGGAYKGPKGGIDTQYPNSCFRGQAIVEGWDEEPRGHDSQPFRELARWVLNGGMLSDDQTTVELLLSAVYGDTSPILVRASSDNDSYALQVFGMRSNRKIRLVRGESGLECATQGTIEGEVCPSLDNAHPSAQSGCEDAYYCKSATIASATPRQPGCYPDESSSQQFCVEPLLDPGISETAMSRYPWGKYWTGQTPSGCDYDLYNTAGAAGYNNPGEYMWPFEELSKSDISGRVYIVQLKEGAADVPGGYVPLVGLDIDAEGEHSYDPDVGEKMRSLLEPSHRNCSQPRVHCSGESFDARLPLEDELSDDGDDVESSWKHYLQLARQAADESDLLAQEYIDNGIEVASHDEALALREEDRERIARDRGLAAVEDLQDICGTEIDPVRLLSLFKGSEGELQFTQNCSGGDCSQNTCVETSDCSQDELCTAGMCVKDLKSVLADNIDIYPELNRLKSCLDGEVEQYMHLGKEEGESAGALCIWVDDNDPNRICQGESDERCPLRIADFQSSAQDTCLLYMDSSRIPEGTHVEAVTAGLGLLDNNVSALQALSSIENECDLLRAMRMDPGNEDFTGEALGEGYLKLRALTSGFDLSGLTYKAGPANADELAFEGEEIARISGGFAWSEACGEPGEPGCPPSPATPWLCGGALPSDVCPLPTEEDIYGDQAPLFCLQIDCTDQGARALASRRLRQAYFSAHLLNGSREFSAELMGVIPSDFEYYHWECPSAGCYDGPEVFGAESLVPSSGWMGPFNIGDTFVGLTNEEISSEVDWVVPVDFFQESANVPVFGFVRGGLSSTNTEIALLGATDTSEETRERYRLHDHSFSDLQFVSPATTSRHFLVRRPVRFIGEGLVDGGNGFVMPWASRKESHLAKLLLAQATPAEVAKIAEDKLGLPQIDISDPDDLRHLVGATQWALEPTFYEEYSWNRDALWDGIELLCEARQIDEGDALGFNALRCAVPTIETVSDIDLLKEYYECVARQFVRGSEYTVLANVPAAAGDPLRRNSTFGGVEFSGGGQAASLSELRISMVGVREGPRRMGSALVRVGRAISSLRSEIERVNASYLLNDIDLSQKLESNRIKCEPRGSNHSGVGLTGGAGIGVGFGAGFSSSEGCDPSRLDALALEIRNLRDELVDSTLDKAFEDFLREHELARLDFRDARDALVDDIESIDEQLSLFGQVRARARRALGRALYLDPHNAISEEYVSMGLQSRFETSRVRYERAHQNAKRLAFLAKRAIEMRIGETLAGLSEDLPLVPAPSAWESTLCASSPIDFSALTDGSLGDYADAFVGDYVDKLENVVESYRLVHSFQDGEDQAVLSLKDDLLGVQSTCKVESTNLLVNGGNLGERWRAVGCDSDPDLAGTPCVNRLLSGVTIPFEPILGGAVIPRRLAFGLGCDPSSQCRYTESPQVPGVPGSAWAQSVELPKGRFTFSWYVRSDVSGDGFSDGIPTAFVVDGAGVDLLGENYVHPDVAGDWQRYYALVENPIGQEVTIGFAAPQNNGVPEVGATVVVAAPMLALYSRNPADLSPPEQFQDAGPEGTTFDACQQDDGTEFRRKYWTWGLATLCPGGYEVDCPNPELHPYWETTFDLNQLSFQSGADAVAALAKGSFNYRIEELGLNFVGTALQACEDSATPQSCYSSPFLQYSLHHSGPINFANYRGEPFQTPLFPGRIEWAKGLASERSLATPLGLDDAKLMNPFLRAELAGRPLDGTFTLRIWDHAGIEFERLEDVQVLLKYRYWTRSN